MIFTLFFQGIVSFFSPCVLPLVPLYVSYMAGGAKEVDENGEICYPRKKVLLNTVFFVVGISFAFFLLGVGFTALGRFFSGNRTLFARISGIIMIVFGLYQFGFFGRSMAIEKERRFHLSFDGGAMGPLYAFILGFTFSFAWTPCVGPALGGVLLMAGSASASKTGFMLIGCYTVGFVAPFLAGGLFTGKALEFFKHRKNIVSAAFKVGAAILILMGFMTLTGFMNGFTGYLSSFGDNSGAQPTENYSNEDAQEIEGSESGGSSDEIAAPDFTLTDQYGNEHTLSEYKGKVVFLNFWATWCPPCKAEMPDIQKLYEEHGENGEDLIVLGVAAPNLGREVSREGIIEFLSDEGYTFPVVFDESYETFSQYGISAFPTTFMIDRNGNIFGYAPSALTKDIMENIVKQTMEGEFKDIE